MDGNYWILAIVSFLFVLCKIKYETISSLKDSIMEYLSNLCSKEVIEQEDIFELEELTDMITSFIVENKEIFCKYKVKE